MRKTGLTRGVVLCVWVLAIGSSVQAATITVRADGSGDYGTIQEAIDAANPSDQIVLHPGTYQGQGNRDIDFSGKAITVTGTDPDDPSVVAATIIDCQADLSNEHRGVKFENGEGLDSVLTGVTITNGWTTRGGGIFCQDSSPTITKCNISGNAAKFGAGIYSTGGGPLISKCVLTDNQASFSGGAIYCYDSSAKIENCTISNNSCDSLAGLSFGGGIFCSINSDPEILNCLIIGNSADRGAGVYCGGDSTVTITNCTISGNLLGGGFGSISGTTVMKNCILWGNSGTDGQEISLFGTQGSCVLIVSYSYVQGGQAGGHVAAGSTLTWGSGNVDMAPLFVNVDDPDGQDNVFSTADDGLALQAGSSCIDAADGSAAPSTDIVNNARHDDTGTADTGVGSPQYVDIGAYEFQGTSTFTGILSVQTTPVSGQVLVDGASWGSAPQSRQIQVGSYTVSFGNVAGYIKPANQQATVQKNQTSNVTGTYRADCNSNGIDDQLDIADDTSQDCNDNGIPDECEDDSDDDGLIDPCDGCPDDPDKTEPGQCGCGNPETQECDQNPDNDTNGDDNDTTTNNDDNSTNNTTGGDGNTTGGDDNTTGGDDNTTGTNPGQQITPVPGGCGTFGVAMIIAIFLGCFVLIRRQ